MVEPELAQGAEGRHPHVFRPIQVGTFSLDHRLVVPPHGGGNGSLLGTAAEFEQHAALWLAKLSGGMRWLGGGPNFVRNPLPPGFEPTGVGAHGPGFFRDPRYPDRIGELAARVHAGGGLLSVQMVLQGGMPIAPSATLSSYADHRIPHALDLDEVRWLVREYGASAAIAIDAGVDAIEVHANHDDLVQWFLSPLTNRRDDEYGGTAEDRRRFLREIVEAIRSHATRPITLGLRLCLDEMIDGGFGVDDCAATVAAFTAEGTVDYFSLDVGNNWGDPSYIPNGWYDDHQWAPLCGAVKTATDRPIVYAGRVLDVAQADAVLAAGHADLVAMARATMADPDIVAKTRAGAEDRVRPCIGLNECIHRRLVEGLVYACGVSPRFAREAEPPPPVPAVSRSVLVVGGGPAGTELAALCAERGHDVELWEREPRLGGALAIAALARANRRYQDWIDYQARRLEASGVRVVLGREATRDDVLAAAVDVVAVATGTSPRRPDVPGRDLPHVVTISEALTGIDLGPNVLLVAEDDGPAPLSVADHLAGLGHHVTLVYQSAGLAPLVGKYSAGAMYARLIDGGVTLVPMARLVEVEAGTVRLASTYGRRRWSVEGVDSVVLACGSVPVDGLFLALKHRHPDVHLLGDAYAPRRMVFATRQAWSLAAVIDKGPAVSPPSTPSPS